jgi:hypothetical protein
MPVWLTGKLIGYALAGLFAAGLLTAGYVKVRNYFVSQDNLRVELSNATARANRAEVSLKAELIANQLREQHVNAIREIRAETQQEIAEIRDKAELNKEVLEDRARLSRVALAKPELVQKLSNRATRRVFNELETIYNTD